MSKANRDWPGVLEHELAVGVIKAGAAGGEDGDGDGAVAVIDDRAVPAVGGEDGRSVGR
jgi:hypothetical protein